MKRNGRSTDAWRAGSPLLLSLVALWLVCACAPPQPSLPAPRELKVLSYNLRHNVDFYEERMALMADGIAALAPDVIGLQEIEIAVEQGEQLADMIRERDPSLDYQLSQVFKSGAGGALTGEGIGIMSRFALSDIAVLEMEEGRVSLFARLDDVGGHSVAFGCTHLTSDGGDALRGQQASDTLAFLEENARIGDARVLVGDFNAVPGDEAITNVIGAEYIDTYLAANGEQRTLSEGNTSPVVLGTDNPEQHFQKRIDFVFARGGDLTALEVRDSEVVLDEPRADGLYPSDHLGVLTTLRLLRSP